MAGAEAFQKSFVGGKYVSVSALGSSGRKLVRAGGQMKAAKQSGKLASFRGRRDVEETKGMLEIGNRGWENNDQLKDASGFAVRTGGKRGKSHVFVRPDAHPSSHVHEAAHAEVNRSSYRLHHQISGNPAKKMREEARADYLSRGHFEDNERARRPVLGLFGKKPQTSESGYGRTARATRETERGRGSRADDLAYRQAAIGAYASPKTAAYGFAESRKQGQKAIKDYSDVQDRMKAAGTKVRKAYDMPMVRDARGQFRGRMEMAPVLMVQTDITLDNVDREDEVEKAWSKSTKIQAGLGALGGAGAIAAGYKGHKEAQRLGPKTMKSLSAKEKVFGVRGGMARLAGTERKELAKAMNEEQRARVNEHYAKRNQASKVAAVGLIGGVGSLALSRRGGNQAVHLLTQTPKKVRGTSAMLRGIKGTRGVPVKVLGSELKNNKAGAATLGALGAGFGASNVSSYHSKKADEIKAASRKRVSKGMPDGADVHIQGVLRPIGKLKKKKA